MNRHDNVLIYPQGKYLTLGNEVTILKGTTGHIRFRLGVLAGILDRLDWNRIKAREDVISYLSLAERILVSPTSLLPSAA